MTVEDFTKDDVDMDAVKKTATAETKEIFSSPQGRQGRSYGAIYKVVEQSHIAEHYMIEHHGYKNDKRKYMDIKKNGVTVDVKTSFQANINEQKNGLLKKLAGRRGNIPVADYIMGFDIVDGVYKFRYYEAVPKKNEISQDGFIINENVYVPTCGTPCGNSRALFIAMRDRKGVNQAIKILKTYGHEVIV